MNSLDINSYSKKELMDILKLPNEYNKEMVNKQCETMKKKFRKKHYFIRNSKKKLYYFLRFCFKFANKRYSNLF